MVSVISSIAYFLLQRFLDLFQYPKSPPTHQAAKRIAPTSRFTPSYLRMTVQHFILQISYRPIDVDLFRREALVHGLENFTSSVGLGDDANVKQVCKNSAAMAELSYHDHDFECQLQIAKFTWYMIYIDDLASTMLPALQNYQRKSLAGIPDEDPVFRAFSEHLSDMYQFWDAIPANCINCATLEFINGCILEALEEFQNLKLSPVSSSWPYFLRTKTGVASAYAFMIFVKSAHTNLTDFTQAIPDIARFIDLTNDVLSLYKEELAGETANYIHNCAAVQQKDVVQVLQDVSLEALSCYHRVSSFLKLQENEKGLQAWETFVNGYVGFHLSQERYRLRELLEGTQM
ncbi:hypothetical protein D9758_010798 [Tetrapyrgos nigripes]|uniref:Terpene synthase n=1 Tax=Tetrapyrgos nigripes TaxID=182062 RepID=A0A8H5FYZ3_9AGAR|nr:hypothetical protein D9758_010798 [Tetrapyrgos nigripes]